MEIIEMVYVVFAIASFIALLFVVRHVPSVFRLVTFGAQKPGDVIAEELRRTLLRQLTVSFWAMMASGLVAVAILALALLKGIFFTSWSDISGIVGVIAGLGDSALFGFFYKIWKDCQAGMRI